MFGEVHYDDLLDAFRCEECGEWSQNLSFHVRAHNMTIAEYRKKHGINKTTPLTSYEHRKKMAESAVNIGNMDKYNAEHNENKFVKGENRVQKYERSPETMRFLKTELPKLGVEARKKNNN